MLQSFFGRYGRHVFAAFVFASCIAAAFLVSGCASLAADAIAPRTVDRYCTVLTAAERELVRDRFNAQLSPHAIAIACAGDDPPTVGPLLLDLPSAPAIAAPGSDPLVHLRL